MSKNCLFLKFVCIVFTLWFALAGTLCAEVADETLVQFTSSQATMEDDPNQGVYNITIFSPDGQWKMQLNYHSDSMFGTFTNDDFRLSGTGKYYNYARNPKNDMVFYSFTDMVVTVADEGTLYRVHANCLANNNMRFIVEATIAAPKPTSTRTDSLGYARITTNSFYGTYTIKAENERYKLAYGIVSTDLLGTFYRADMLMPELTDKSTNKAIEVTTATAVHTQQGDTTLLSIDILSSDLVLYSLKMFNGPYEVEIQEERDIRILYDVVVQDLTQMYGCYQVGGQNDEYAVAVAFTPDAFESGRTEWTSDDIFLPYTNIIHLPTSEFVDIFDANAALDNVDGALVLKADITSFEGILYHVCMNLKAGNTPPPTSDTVNIDFGRIAVLDFSQGIGTIGLGAVKQGKYQMRFYFSGYDLTSALSNQDFVMEKCDMMVVNEQTNTYVFHDAKYVTANFEKVDSVTFVTVDMICVDDVLYHATMQIEPMQCLSDMTVSLDATEEILMVAFQEGLVGDGAEYTLQFQDMERVYDKNYNIVGDGYAFSFYFRHEGTASVAGEYGYSAGTLADNECHTIFEKGCEVRIAPLAGTLTLEPKEQVTVLFNEQNISTCVYQVKFKFVGENNVIYSGEGENFLLCIDPDGYWIEMDEEGISRLTEALAEKGYQVRKMLKGGKFIIEKEGETYDLLGKK